jgi:hypothetical protein
MTARFQIDHLNVVNKQVIKKNLAGISVTYDMVTLRTGSHTEVSTLITDSHIRIVAVRTSDIGEGSHWQVNGLTSLRIIWMDGKMLRCQDKASTIFTFTVDERYGTGLLNWGSCMN